MKPLDSNRHNSLDDLQALLTGSLIVAIGLVFIKQAGLLTGGTTGLAFLIHYQSGLNFGLVLFLANSPFYVLAIWQMGWVFTVKTMVAVLMVSLLTEVIPMVISINEINLVFAAVSGGLLIGVGMIILFRHRASMGGINILVLFLQEKFGWRAGIVQMLFDCCILAVALTITNPWLIATSVLGAVLLNFVLAVNHKPGRYMAF